MSALKGGLRPGRDPPNSPPHTSLAGTSVPVQSRRRMKWHVRLPRTTRGDLGDGLRTVLDVLEPATEALPPLKASVGTVRALWTVADRYKANQKSAKMLLDSITRNLDSMYLPFDQHEEDFSEDTRFLFARFESELSGIKTEIESWLGQRSSIYTRIRHQHRDESKLEELHGQLTESIAAFNRDLEILHQAEANAHAKANVVAVQRHFERVETRLNLLISLNIGLF
ncbi:hypothetical protein HMN09_00726700 [Mycena chlorophos]|uniref:Uncharacterized protein n=1 Tax=Mycena chlorophos TaxID=658473 RepID=A0A8H6W8N1_MYCCL|nr:hypothetical protein HMN09_00726700 [Mycena chlorophos]